MRAILDAWNLGDVEGVLPFIADDAVLLPARAQLEGIEYRGHDGVRQLDRDLSEEWEGLRVEPLEIREAGDHVVARTTLIARGRASGVDVEVPLGWLIEMRGGKVVHSRTFSDPDEAYRAAGLDP